MPRTEDEDIATDFGRRLAEAIKAAGTTQSAVARKLNLLGARMPRLLGKGRDPVRGPEPETVRKLADHLGVAFEWLAIGRGPRAPGAWAASGRDAAEQVARSSGVTEAAIAAARARYEGAALSGTDWVLAFVIENGLANRGREFVARAAELRSAASAMRRATLDTDAAPSERRERVKRRAKP